jgi:predicted HD phosphohydrolase
VRVAACLDEVLDLYQRWGDQNYDEDLSQREHALQTAALAVQSGVSDGLVAAALLHDVGHLLELESGRRAPTAVLGDLRHEVTGSRYLAALFPPAVTGPVGLHVQAKRYLCAADRQYLLLLSVGSQRSLVWQGPMAADEVAAFPTARWAEEAILLRRWDDAGKVDGLEVAPLERYQALLERLSAASTLRSSTLSSSATEPRPG